MGIPLSYFNNNEDFMVVSEKVNSRVEELEFLISVMNELRFKYPQHNRNLLESVVSQLEYQKSNEETTVIAKAKSELQKKNPHRK